MNGYDSQTTAATMIVGIGSPFGDDQAGWLAVEQLRQEERCVDVELRVATVPLDVLDWIENVCELHLIDACILSGCDSEYLRFQWLNGQLVRTWPRNAEDLVSTPVMWKNLGTHGVGLIDVLHLAEATGQLPEDVVVWAIPIHSVARDEGTSAASRACVRATVSALSSEVRRRHAAISTEPSMDANRRVGREECGDVL